MYGMYPPTKFTTTIVNTSGRPSSRLAHPTTTATIADITVRPFP